MLGLLSILSMIGGLVVVGAIVAVLLMVLAYPIVATMSNPTGDWVWWWSD